MGSSTLISLGYAEPASPRGKLFNLPLGEGGPLAVDEGGRTSGTSNPTLNALQRPLKFQRALVLSFPIYFFFFFTTTATPRPMAATISTATAASSITWSLVLGFPVRETALVHRA